MNLIGNQIEKRLHSNFIKGLARDIISLSILLVLSQLGQARSFQQQKMTLIEVEEFKTLFKQGEGDYACFRIPAVVTTNNGAILAFCEARKRSCSDTGDIDLVMKKSTDNGLTWSELKIIWDAADNVCGNPAPVVDLETGKVHLLLTWNNGKDHESQIINGTSSQYFEVFSNS